MLYPGPDRRVRGEQSRPFNTLMFWLRTFGSMNVPTVQCKQILMFKEHPGSQGTVTIIISMTSLFTYFRCADMW